MLEPRISGDNVSELGSTVDANEGNTFHANKKINFWKVSFNDYQGDDPTTIEVKNSPLGRAYSGKRRTY